MFKSKFTYIEPWDQSLPYVAVQRHCLLYKYTFQHGALSHLELPLTTLSWSFPRMAKHYSEKSNFICCIISIVLFLENFFVKGKKNFTGSRFHPFLIMYYSFIFLSWKDQRPSHDYSLKNVNLALNQLKKIT